MMIWDSDTVLILTYRLNTHIHFDSPSRYNFLAQRDVIIYNVLIYEVYACITRDLSSTLTS